MTFNNEKKSAVVFGGSGFIGSHLSKDLKEMGYQVYVADITPPLDPEAEYIYCDVKNEILLDLPKTPDIVFNLAAVHRTPGHETEEYFECNIAGAINITNWCSKVNVKSVIFTSSISVYGPSYDLKDETSETTPVHAYGKSKLMAENIFRSWYETSPNQRNLIICRPAVIFGYQEKGNFSRMAKAMKKGYFLIPGNGELTKSSGYVKDLTRSFLFVYESSTGFTLYNFCFPKLYSLLEITETMSDIARWGKPKRLSLKILVPILKRLGSPASHIAERIEKLLLPSLISPGVLIQKRFVWRFDLRSSLEDWYQTSIFDTNLD